MFSFHKPKIYRSNLGCCICKAKSSSSRFTDSKKYENEFERCFRIQEKRTGEICNACVLLVKRWKKLSPDNRLTKHWHHVVDARAGPGTKLTVNRRLTTNNASQHHQQQSSNDPSSSSGGQSRSQKSSQACKSDVLPLSSNQANNQSSSSSGSGSTRGRTSSLSKARAIDTNVSTFTFGEPPSTYRRSYMTSEPSTNYLPYSSASSSSSPLAKPQSALNSSAFESVIKRFRQRQQQQHMEAQRRLLNRHERQRLRHLNNSQSPADNTKASTAPMNNNSDRSSTPTTITLPKSDNDTTSEHQEDSTPNDDSNNTISPPTKHVKRMSENYGSHGSLDALKISSVLDALIWRKEKICCGIIFRGLYNEVAIFPKLLRPCDCRLLKSNRNIEAKEGAVAEPRSDSQDEMEETQIDKDILLKKSDQPDSPPPRATKSGSISSCTSSTSGTGSMEPTRDEMNRLNRAKNDPSPVVVRPRSVPTKKRRQQRQQKDDAESTSTSGASISSSGGGCGKEGNADSPNESDHSSSRMILMADECDIVDDDDDAEDDELMMADDDACESSNDASSSGESLIEIGTKKSSTVV